MKTHTRGSNSLFTLSLFGLVVAAVVALAIIAQGGKGSLGKPSEDNTSSVAIQVPTSEGKPGESGPPTPFPTYSLPPITPVPPDGDKDFDATPIPGYYVPSTPKPGDPYVLSIDVTLGKSTTKETADLSTLIVDGIVKQVGPARWTTTDGKRPANPWAKDNKDYIFTPVVIETSSSLKEAKGIGTGSQVMVLAIGGQVGQDRVVWTHDNDKTFKVGQRVIVYLRETKPSDPIQTVDNQPLWRLIERYTVTADGKAQNWHSDIPMQQLLSEIDAAVHSTKP
jgi:hypothetical protein